MNLLLILCLGGIFAYFLWNCLIIIKISQRIKPFEQDKNLNKEYNESIKKYSRKHASLYWNLDGLIAYTDVNKGNLYSVGNVLVALGILGTFIGLTAGLMQSDLSTNSSSEDMLNSIQALFEGSKTAFITSLFGMFFSVTYGYILRGSIKKWNKELNRFCQEFDDDFYKSDIELQNEIIISVGEQITEKLSAAVGITIDTTISKLLEELSNTIKESMAGAADKLDDAAMHLDAVLSEETLDNISKLSKTFVDLSDSLQDTAKALSVAAVDFKKELVDECLPMIKESVSGFKGVVTQLNDMMNRMDGSVKKQDNLVDKVGTNIAKVTATTDKLDGIAIKLGNMDESVSETLAEIDKNLNVYVEEMTNFTNQLVESYTQDLTNACNNINATTNGLKDTLETYNGSINGLKEVTVKYTNLINNKE